MTTKTPLQLAEELEEKIISQRALLQTYLASDMDIDKMDYVEVVSYAIADVPNHNEFLCEWKDYAFLRGQAQAYLTAFQFDVEFLNEVNAHSCCDIEAEYFEPCKRCKMIRERLQNLNLAITKLKEIR